MLVMRYFQKELFVLSSFLLLFRHINRRRLLYYFQMDSSYMLASRIMVVKALVDVVVDWGFQMPVVGDIRENRMPQKSHLCTDLEEDDHTFALNQFCTPSKQNLNQASKQRDQVVNPKRCAKFQLPTRSKPISELRENSFGKKPTESIQQSVCPLSLPSSNNASTQEESQLGVQELKIDKDKQAKRMKVIQMDLSIHDWTMQRKHPFKADFSIEKSHTRHSKNIVTQNRQASNRPKPRFVINKEPNQLSKKNNVRQAGQKNRSTSKEDGLKQSKLSRMVKYSQAVKDRSKKRLNISFRQQNDTSHSIQRCISRQTRQSGQRKQERSISRQIGERKQSAISRQYLQRENVGVRRGNMAEHLMEQEWHSHERKELQLSKNRLKKFMSNY